MKIISKRERITVTSYSLSYDWPEEPGSGLGFDCDEHGNVDESNLQPAGLDNLRQARTGVVDGRPIGAGVVKKYVHSYWEYAVGLCNNCQREVELRGFTNTCECGADYNGSGQQLADRSQWGSETGESVADIMMADTDPWGGDY